MTSSNTPARSFVPLFTPSSSAFHHRPLVMATSSTQSSAHDAFMADLLKDVDQAAPTPSQASQPTRPSSSFATAFRSKAPAAPAASPPPAKQPSLSQISQSLFAKPKPPTRPSTQPAKPSPAQRQNAPPSQPAVAGPSTQRTAFSRGSGSSISKPLARSQSAQSPLRPIKRELAATPALSDVSFADDDDWLADLDEKHLLAATAKTEPTDVPMPPPAPAASTSSLVKQASRTQSKLWAQRANEEKVRMRGRVNEMRVAQLTRRAVSPVKAPHTSLLHSLSSSISTRNDVRVPAPQFGTRLTASAEDSPLHGAPSTRGPVPRGQGHRGRASSRDVGWQVRSRQAQSRLARRVDGHARQGGRLHSLRWELGRRGHGL